MILPARAIHPCQGAPRKPPLRVPPKRKRRRHVTVERVPERRTHVSNRRSGKGVDAHRARALGEHHPACVAHGVWKNPNAYLSIKLVVVKQRSVGKTCLLVPNGYTRVPLSVTVPVSRVLAYPQASALAL